MKPTFVILLFLSAISAFGQSPNLSTEIVWAVSSAAHTYKIASKSNKQLSIYQGKSPDEIEWKKPLYLKKGETITVENPERIRLYFATIVDKDTVMFSDRRLAMEGTPNFRDLGGIKTKDGKTIRWGKLFRSGDLGTLSQDDLNMMENLNIATVVDFRGEVEITRSPDQYPEDSNIKSVNTVIGASNPKKGEGLMEALKDPDVTHEKMDSLFNLYYKYAVGSVVDYKAFFDALLSIQNGEALLFHCAAGKDRTGLGSALLLYALGVPEESIVEEFYLSNLYTRNILKGTDRYEGINEEALEVLSGVQPYYIKTTFEEIRKKYGSIEKILEKELGVDESIRKRLIALYTY